MALDEDEAGHLTRVLRLEVGAAVAVFDGRGAEFEAVVERVGRHEAEVRVGLPRPSALEARIAITLAQAVLKGDRMDDVVRDAVMIGAAAIQPVITERTEVALATLQRARRRERWERVAISAAKQCGRALVPPILEPLAFAAVNEAQPGLPPPWLMLVEPRASAATVALNELEVGTPHQATLLIGPEGGWSPGELTLAERRSRLVAIGGRTLRADAMATIAIAALFAKWGEY